MIDRLDVTTSKLGLILFRALRNYSDEELFDWLVDDDCLLRHAVAREMHLRPSRENFERLKGLTQSRRHEHREVAILALGQFGTPECQYANETFPLLLEKMDDDYYEVCAAAVSSAGQLARLKHELPTAVVERILELANSERLEIREAVAYSFVGMNLQNVLVTEALGRLLADRESPVREAADFAIEAREELQSELQRIT